MTTLDPDRAPTLAHGLASLPADVAEHQYGYALKQYYVLYIPESGGHVSHLLMDPDGTKVSIKGQLQAQQIDLYPMLLHLASEIVSRQGDAQRKTYIQHLIPALWSTPP